MIIKRQHGSAVSSLFPYSKDQTVRNQENLNTSSYLPASTQHPHTAQLSTLASHASVPASSISPSVTMPAKGQSSAGGAPSPANATAGSGSDVGEGWTSGSEDSPPPKLSDDIRPVDPQHTEGQTYRHEESKCEFIKRTCQILGNSNETDVNPFITIRVCDSAGPLYQEGEGEQPMTNLPLKGKSDKLKKYWLAQANWTKICLVYFRLIGSEAKWSKFYSVIEEEKKKE